MKVSNCRPVSWVTSVYKIIAKILSRRLSDSLHQTISMTLSAFADGRQILKATLVANEVVEYSRRSKGEGSGTYA